MRARTILLAFLALLGSCFRSAGPPAAPRVRREWPAAPAPAQVRWAGEFPDPARPAGGGPAWWERAFDAVVGIDPAAPAPPPVLARPFGIAAADGGFLVADPDARQVLRVAWPRGAAAPVRCRAHEWVTPIAVATGPDGAVWVADAGAKVVVLVPRSGPCRVVGAGRLERPSGVAVAGDRVFVVDPPRHAVVAFGADGREALRFGERGDASGPGLNFPTGVAAAADGTLLVVDSLNFRVSRFSVAGEYLGSFGARGDGGGAFARPKAVAVDARGQIYVTDAQHDVVVVFAPDGRFTLAIGGSGAGPGDLTLPAGLAIGDGRLFVADSYNHRVEVYELLAEAL